MGGKQIPPTFKEIGVPKKLLVDDIINFDYDDITYTGVVIGFSTIAETPNGPYTRYASIRAVINNKLRLVKINLSRNSQKRYNVQLRYRHGQSEGLPTIKVTE